jgi:hypothetical protein
MAAALTSADTATPTVRSCRARWIRLPMPPQLEVIGIVPK